jgi:hypothetical protein
LQEFPVRIKEAPGRSGVEVPPLLERVRGNGTLRCVFINCESMTDCMQAQTATGVQLEAVFDEPAPLLLMEVTLLHVLTPHLADLVRFMVEKRCYMRAWGENSSVFFGPLLRDSQCVVDFRSAET